MARELIKRAVGRRPEVLALISSLARGFGTPLCIEDADGRPVHGEVPTSGDSVTRVPISHDSIAVGWVTGGAGADGIAALIEHLLAREAEGKALGAEVLHLYREINLIYGFTEQLAALLDVERVAQLTLQQARQMIVATDGLVLLYDDAGEQLRVVTGFGDELPSLASFARGEGILGAIAFSGIGEIVNDVLLDPRRITPHTAMRALMVAPLKVGERVTGVICLGSTIPMAYTAAELKLLNTLALQTAAAMESARLFERAIQAAQERERLLALHQAAELARAKLESELTLAARIQADLFPATLPALDGYDLAARNRPARHCGGDYYDAIPVTRAKADGRDAADARTLLCVADVAGKGLPAALVMANMQATLRALLGRTASIPQLAADASALLFASTPAEKYVTAALVELTAATGELRFVGAGHVSNLIVRANGDVVSLESTGMPLGLLPVTTPFQEIRHRLLPGDALVLFSDGVTEAQNEAGDELDEPGLREVLRDSSSMSAAEIIDRVFEAIDRFAGGAPQFDDITLLVVKRA